MKQLQSETLEELKPLLTDWKEPKSIEARGKSIWIRWNASWQDECYITIWQEAIEFIYYGRCPCCGIEDYEFCNRIDIAAWDRTIPTQWADYMHDNFSKED